MRSIGPAIGGIIVAAAGAAFAFIFNAFSYCALILALWQWKPETVKSTLPRETLGPAMVAGLRYVAMSPNLLKVMFRGFLFGLSAIVILALLPLVARDLVHGTALTYGIMLGFFGLGAIGGALLSARLRELLGNEWLVRGAFVAFAISCALLSIGRNMWLSCIFLLPAGVSWVLALSLFNVTVQLSTPRWVVGRALALYQTATFGGMAAGSWLWGAVADEYGVPGALLAAAVVLMFGALIGLLLPQPEFEDLNLDPSTVSANRNFGSICVRAAIMIMVDYKIAQEMFRRSFPPWPCAAVCVSAMVPGNGCCCVIWRTRKPGRKVITCQPGLSMSAITSAGLRPMLKCRNGCLPCTRETSRRSFIA